MTSQIAVLNKHAVALATDSVITIGSGLSDLYTFNSANKLFRLSEEDPLAAMIYGNADLVGYGWEPLLKRFRATSEPHRKKLGLHMEALILWLQVEGRDFFDDAWTLEHAVKSVKKRLWNSVGTARTNQVDLFNQCRSDLDEIRTQDYVKDFGPPDLAVAESWAGEALRSAIDEMWTVIEFTDETAALMLEFGLECLIRDVDAPDTSGLVVVGFGQADRFPSLEHIVVHGYLEGRLRYGHRDTVSTSFRSPAAIRAFADSAVSDLNLRGFDQRITDRLIEMASAQFQTIQQKFAQDHKMASAFPEVNAQAQKLADNFEGDLRKEVSALSEKYHVHPLNSAMALMPMSELADVARGLISLTSIKRAASRQPGETSLTVGGSVDVAVLSQEDGFVWIDRKHYFTPALNPRYIGRHYARANKAVASGYGELTGGQDGP